MANITISIWENRGDTKERILPVAWICFWARTSWHHGCYVVEGMMKVEGGFCESNTWETSFLSLCLSVPLSICLSVLLLCNSLGKRTVCFGLHEKKKWPESPTFLICGMHHGRRSILRAPGQFWHFKGSPYW